MGPCGKSLGHWRICPPRGLGDQVLPFSLLLPGYEVSSFALLHSSMMMCSYHRPKSNGASTHGLEPSKGWAQINLFSSKMGHLRYCVVVSRNKIPSIQPRTRQSPAQAGIECGSSGRVSPLENLAEPLVWKIVKNNEFQSQAEQGILCSALPFKVHMLGSLVATV